MYATAVSAAVVLAIVPLVTAGCQMQNKQSAPPAGPEKDAKVCRGQGPGAWTFSMHTVMSTTGMPTSDNGDPNGSFDNSNTDTYFQIFDEGCNLKGTYDPPNCGYPPWTIEENFLKQVLTVQSVDMGVGDPKYVFNYGDGQYSIGNNHCVCHDLGGFFAPKKACGCAFPVSGVSPDKAASSNKGAAIMTSAQNIALGSGGILSPSTSSVPRNPAPSSMPPKVQKAPVKTATKKADAKKPASTPKPPKLRRSAWRV